MSKSKLPHLKEGKVVEYGFIDATKQEIVDLINKVKPISLKKNGTLVDKIAERYPHISKGEAALIVKYAFTAIRDALILGNILYIFNLFHMTHIHFYKRQVGEAKYSGVRITTKTPKSLR